MLTIPLQKDARRDVLMHMFLTTRLTSHLRTTLALLKITLKNCITLTYTFILQVNYSKLSNSRRYQVLILFV